jgi:hypothetical protein
MAWLFVGVRKEISKVKGRWLNWMQQLMPVSPATQEVKLR